MTKKKIPRALHPRVRVFCTACEHVARRYKDMAKQPCVWCGAKGTCVVRPKGWPTPAASK